MRVIAVALYRLSHRLGRHARPLAVVVKQLNQFITGADIAYEATIGADLRLPHPIGVVVTPYAVLGDRVTIFSNVTLGGRPTIGNDVFVGTGARLVGTIRIGSRVKIGANSVVTSDVGDGVVVAGIPARVLREARPDESFG